MYQIKETKFQHVSLLKNENEKDILLEFCEVPFTIESSDKPEQGIPKQEFSYKYISESCIFKEDDRVVRPLVIIQHKDQRVNNIWFTLTNFKENKIEKV